jgi:hypothetical protein
MLTKTSLYLYHCYFCGLDFGLSAVITPTCPCCRNEDDVLLLTEIKYEAHGSTR